MRPGGTHGNHLLEFASTAVRGLLSLFPTLHKDASELKKFAGKAMGKLARLLGNENGVGSTIVKYDVGQGR
jgi:hypothetical protein